MSRDPLGLSPGQRVLSNQNVIIDRFVKRYGDRIKLDATGRWYVEDNGVIITVPLPPWPSDDAERDAGKTLNECVAIVREGN